MPIFDFACRDCGKEFEELVRAGTAVECPACGGASVERRLSIPAPPVTAGKPMNLSNLGPPPGGGCCGGSCHGHSH